MSALFLPVHQAKQVTRQLQWTISSVFFSLSAFDRLYRRQEETSPQHLLPHCFPFLTFILFSTKFSQLLSSLPLVREILSSVKMVTTAWGIFSFWQTPIHPPLSSFLFLCRRAIFCAGVNGGQKFWQHTPHFTNTVESKQGLNPPPSLHSLGVWCCTSLRRFCLY